MADDPEMNALVGLTGQVKGLQIVLNALLAMHAVSTLKESYEASRAAEMLTELRDRLTELADGLSVHLGDSEIAARVAAGARQTVESSFNDSIGLLEKIAAISLQVASPASAAKN